MEAIVPREAAKMQSTVVPATSCCLRSNPSHERQGGRSFSVEVDGSASAPSHVAEMPEQPLSRSSSLRIVFGDFIVTIDQATDDSSTAAFKRPCFTPHARPRKRFDLWVC